MTTAERGPRPRWQESEGRATDSRRRQESLQCCRRANAVSATTLFSESSLNSVSKESFLRRDSWGDFRSVLVGLRAKCPAAMPVVVRTAWLPPDTLGECIRRPARFVIRLSSRMNQQEAIDTLIHEWAHALAWNYSLDRMARDPDVNRELFEAASHDEAWGCAYSRVWRAHMEQGSR
jgi:hypothetical protein